MRRATTALAVALAAGCAANVPFHRAPVPAGDAADWGPLREAASRRASLYDGFVHRANASATWLSPEVREAGVRRLAEWQAKNQAELEQALADARAEALLGEEFVVALYTVDPRANDLDVPRSVWHLELDDGTTRVPAATITAFYPNATVKQLYPYVGPFDLTYRVRFKWTGAPLQGRPFKLRIASSLGELVLDYAPEGQRAREWQAP